MFGRFGGDRSVLLAAIESIPLGPNTNRPAAFTPFLAALVNQEVQQTIDGSQRFGPTAYAGELLRQQERMPPAGSEGEERALRRLYQERAKQLAKEILRDEVQYRAATFDLLKRVCDGLAGLPGQRLVLTYTDGFSARDGEGYSTPDELRRVTSRAALSGVVMNSIVASG